MVAASPQEKFPVYLQKVERVEKLPKPCKYGGVAQLGEHLPCKQGVRSSILLVSTILLNLEKYIEETEK